MTCKRRRHLQPVTALPAHGPSADAVQAWLKPDVFKLREILASRIFILRQLAGIAPER